jgi:hypothetical protein
VNSNHSYQEYKVMHTMVPRDLLIPTGIKEPGLAGQSLMSVMVFPNPVHENGMFSIHLATESDLIIQVLNSSGQTMVAYTETHQAGRHLIPFSAGGFAPGLYYYRISNGSQQVSGKMMVN